MSYDKPSKERTNKPSSLNFKSPGEIKVKALPGSVNVKQAKSQITLSKYRCSGSVLPV